MTSENESRPDEQTEGPAVQNDVSSDRDAGTRAEPSLADVVDAMRSQQEATARGFADLTSGLSEFLEKMATVSAAPASSPAPPTEEGKTAQSPQAAAAPAAPVPGAETASAPPATVASAPSPAPADQPQTPQVQAVTPPPVDPAAYAQAIPTPEVPPGVPQGAPPSGFPVAGQPQAAVPSGFPVTQHPQAPSPQVPVAQTPAPQEPQAATGFPDLRQPVRAARNLLRGARAQPAQVGPAQPQPAPQPVVDNRWQQILFGSDLANNQALTALRDKLLEGLLGGERNATGLVGTVLLFQSATQERMPQILKDIGEAYYRWNPRTAHTEDPLRNGLITWLHRKCESAGVSNTIVLVRPGDRFESSRHNAKQRGVEVSQVHGWIVLRDNGKVYTKANVDVK